MERNSPLSFPPCFDILAWSLDWSSVDVVTNSTFAPLCNKKRNFVVPLHDGLAAWSGLLLDNNNFVFVMGKQTQECVSPSSPGFLYAGGDRSETKKLFKQPCYLHPFLLKFYSCFSIKNKKNIVIEVSIIQTNVLRTFLLSQPDS